MDSSVGAWIAQRRSAVIWSAALQIIPSSYKELLQKKRFKIAPVSVVMTVCVLMSITGPHEMFASNCTLEMLLISGDTLYLLNTFVRWPALYYCMKTRIILLYKDSHHTFVWRLASYYCMKTRIILCKKNCIIFFCANLWRKSVNYLSGWEGETVSDKMSIEFRNIIYIEFAYFVRLAGFPDS